MNFSTTRRSRRRNGPQLRRPGSKATRPTSSRRAASACWRRCRAPTGVETLSRYFLHGRTSARRERPIVDQGDQGCGLVERLTAEQRSRLRSPAPAARRHLPRPFGRAADRHSRRADALSQRERAPRAGRLRRPDRQDAGAPDQCRRGLGALQARSRHRSSFDRRSAGHQPQAMADRPAAGRRIHRGRGRASRHPHDFRGRRREAIDLFVPECRAEGIRGDAALLRTRASSSGRRQFVFREFKHSFRSGESVLAAVDAVFKDKLVAASVSSDTDGFPPHIALPDAPPSLVEIWEPAEPDERKDIEGWDAPFDTVNETSPRVKLAKRIARTVKRMVDARRAGRHRTPGGALRRHFDSGAPARRIVRSDHPRVEERTCRSRRRRPPHPHRTYRGDGSDGARRRAATAARRSCARDRAAQSAVRFLGRRSVRGRLRSRPHVAARGARAQGRRRRIGGGRRPRRASTN